MIYRILSDSDHFLFIQFDEEELLRQLKDDSAFVIDCSPAIFKDKWQSIDIRYINDDAYNVDTKHLKREKTIPDIVEKHGHLFLTDKAKNVLEKHLESYGEFLPLSGDCQWMFNPLSMIEATEDSKFDPFLLIIEHIAFDKEDLLFRTPLDDHHGIYCNDEFAKLCIDNKLKGIVFDTELHNKDYDNYKKRVTQ